MEIKPQMKSFSEHTGKIILMLLASLLLFTGCSYRIVRTGYDTSKADYKKCNIAVKKCMVVTDSLVWIGEIRLGDTGFSTFCSEEEALEILKNEGCAIGANIVNIIEDKRPTVICNCFRCRADFYRYKSPLARHEASDIFYSPRFVEERARMDEVRMLPAKRALIALSLANSVISLLVHP
jgi:hypothetical protein